MKDITSASYHDEFSARQQAEIDAVPTHLDGLNRVCRDDGGGVGFARGWFVTVGGNPGFGKSAMALNLASAAAKSGEPIGYISLEMSATQLAARFYAIHTRTPIATLERGGFKPAQWHEVSGKMTDTPPVWVPEHIGTEWSDVTVFVQECHASGCRWFVLDYLQLVQAGDDESISRAITEITTDLRTWAVNEGAVVVALSQFNRQTSAEYRLRPRSQGLWGGMILEASSDQVLLLDHSRYERDGDIARTWLIVDKNRHGPVGEIPVVWDYRTLTMTEGMPHEESLWPS